MSDTLDKIMKKMSPKKETPKTMSPTKPVVLIAPPQVMPSHNGKGEATVETDFHDNTTPIDHDLVDYSNDKRKAIILDPSKINEAMGLIKTMDGLPDLAYLKLSASATEAQKAALPLDYSTRDYPFAILASHRRGLGLFAVRDIPAGQFILREAPLMACSDYILEKAAAYMALKDHNKCQFMSLQRLCQCKGPNNLAKVNCEIPPLLHIWTTNRFDLPDVINDTAFENAGMTLSAVYSVASRINHACDPNVRYGFTPLGEIRIWASKNIERGEEIFRSYLSGSDAEHLATRAERWERLGFQCACNVCVTFPDLPMKPAEEVMNHKYYYDIRIPLPKTPKASKCPLIDRVSKEERELLLKAEEWAASMQEDLVRLFEEFKLSSAFWMVAKMQPPALIVTAMLVDMKDRGVGRWHGNHLEKIIKTGPNLPKAILVQYLEALPKCLTKKDSKNIKDLLMETLQEIADDLATYNPPKKGGGIDRRKTVEDLKDILAIRLADGADLAPNGDDNGKIEDGKDEGEKDNIQGAHIKEGLCDHPQCLEHVEDKVGNGMI